MKICQSDTIADQEMTMPGAEGVRMRVLLGMQEEAPTNFVMRKFDIEPGGKTPHHHHPYEHQIYILEGEGIAMEGDTERAFSAGDCIFVPGDQVHQFRNTGDKTLRFLCLIPRPEPCQA